MGFSQSTAAARLGLSLRMVQYYERGDRGGRQVDIPLTVRLACAAISRGVADFDGEQELVEPALDASRF